MPGTSTFVVHILSEHVSKKRCNTKKKASPIVQLYLGLGDEAIGQSGLVAHGPWR